MRRSPIACRRAVQSLRLPRLQHVWVSDELLDLTAARFFRSSCPHQRRHGSHVPGPLEARRRAAKRRMTVSANFNPHDSSPPPFSFGALFGVLRDFRKNPPPAWKYEPPSLPQDLKPLHSVPSVANLIPQIESVAPPYNPPQCTSHTALSEGDVSITPHHAQAKAGDQCLDVSIKPALVNKVDDTSFDVTESDFCFEEFKSRVAHVAGLKAKKQQEVISDAFRLCCPTHSNPWRYSVRVIRLMEELELNPLPVLRSFKVFGMPPPYITQRQELLVCLDKLYWSFPDTQRQFHGLYVKLAEAALPMEKSTGALQDREILLLLRQLWQSAYLHGLQSTDDILNLLQHLVLKIKESTVREPLAAVLADTANSHHHVVRLVVDVCADQTRFPAVEHILSSVPRKQLTAYATWVTLQLINNVERKTSFSKATYKLHLRVWLELLHRLDTSCILPTTGPTLFDLAMKQLTMHLFGVFTPKPPEHIGVALLVDALRMKHSQISVGPRDSIEDVFADVKPVHSSIQHRVTPMSTEESLAMLFSQMRGTSLSYEDVVEPVLAVVAEHVSLRSVLQLLQAMERQRLTICDFSAIDRLIADKLSAVQKRISASTQPQLQQKEAQLQHAAYVLRASQLIFQVVSRIATPSAVYSPTVTEGVLGIWQTRRQFRHILYQAQAHHALPLAYRNISVDMPFQQQVDLIHQLAHHYSRDLTRTHLEAWRSMYYLYHYLLNNQLPIGPLFTKAAVRVAIIRPLIENRFVSAKRLIWLCGLVAKVEGEEVARKIESDFWQWRGDVIKHAKTRYVQAGGNRHGKAHIGAMKRLGLT